MIILLSLCVQIVAFISLGVIILSTMAMTLNTLPSLRTPRSPDNGTQRINESASTDVEDDDDDGDADNKYLSLIEAVCVCWMAVEYVVRLWASPLRYVAYLTLYLSRRHLHRPKH